MNHGIIFSNQRLVSTLERTLNNSINKREQNKIVNKETNESNFINNSRAIYWAFKACSYRRIFKCNKNDLNFRKSENMQKIFWYKI